MLGKNFKTDYFIADWSFLIFSGIVLFIVLSVIAPLLAHQPSEQLLKVGILHGCLSLCKPEPLEHIAYLLAITVVPITFALWFLVRTKLSKNAAHLKTIFYFLALSAQLCLATFILLNIAQEQKILLKLFGIGLSLLLPILLIYFSNRSRLQLLVQQSFVFRSVVPVGIAFLYTILRLIPSLVTDPYKWGFGAMLHLGSTGGELAAILNGRTNLVDFFPQYQQLSNYLFAPIFQTIQLTPFNYSLVMSLLTCIAMIMVFTLFVILTNKIWAALLLFIPFCSISFFPMQMDHNTQWTFAGYFVAMPLRYFGAILMALLTALYLEKSSKRRMITLFFVGGIVAINNLDFGVPALVGALTVVLFCTTEGLYPRKKTAFWSYFLPSKNKTLAILAVLLVSVSAAVISWLGWTLIRSHRLPEISNWFSFQKVFLVYGFNMLPMPFLGIHWILYLTYMANIYFALVRRANRLIFVEQKNLSKENVNFVRNFRLNQGLLIFSAILGCGTGMYYVGRSHETVLVTLYCAWALAFAILIWNVFDDLPNKWKNFGSGYRLLMILPLAFLLGTWSVFWGTVKYTPSLIDEIKRLSHPTNSFYESFNNAVKFVVDRTKPNTNVGIVHIFGYSIANAAHVKNIVPFTNQETLYTHWQMNNFMTILRTDKVKQVFVETGIPCASRDGQEIKDELQHNGYHYVDQLEQDASKNHTFGSLEYWTKN